MKRSKRLRKWRLSCLDDTFRLEPRLLPSVSVRQASPDGADFVGPDAAVGPDGVEDVHLIATVTRNKPVSYFTIYGPLGFKWETDNNQGGSANAEKFASSSSSLIWDLFINPTVK